MPGDKRRELIIAELKKENKPISGTTLGKLYDVSRQVIVQDVALIRATGLDIIATSKGYILHSEDNTKAIKVVLVKHIYDEIEDELNIVVDFGGVVRNVIIEHPIYGEMVGNMMLENRADVKEFVKDINKFKTYPLMNLTHGVHMHTIEADDEQTLEKITNKLDEEGFVYSS